MTQMMRPSTRFLQESADRGLAAIAARLDHDENCRPWFHLRLSPEPELAHDIWDLGDMCSRYVDAFILGRQVTGNDEHREEEGALRRLLPHCDPFAHPFMAGRMLLAFVDRFLQEPSDMGKRQIEGLIAAIRGRLTFEGDYAYFSKAPNGWTSIDSPIFGGNFEAYPTMALGGIVLALARYLEAFDAPGTRNLLDRLCIFIARESGVFARDGRFRGYTHSGGILTAAVGVMRWALIRGDEETIGQMTGTLDCTLAHSSSWGWVPDGLGDPYPSGETCSLTDALHLAILAARRLNPRYYNIVERFARNQLMENQFRHPELALPPEDHSGMSLIRDRVSNALYGSWASWSLPNSLDNCLNQVEGCCVGAGVRGCYLVWESAIENTGGLVRVNMAFSRNSPWAEVISFQPYEGRMIILIHQPQRLAVRIPDWVDKGKIEVALNDAFAAWTLSPTDYIEIDGLEAGDKVEIRYPLRVAEVCEDIAGQSYRVKWRGDTVVGMEPKGLRYPLYLRDDLDRPIAPMVQRGRYEEQVGGPVRW